MVAQNENRDLRDRQNANDQAIAIELNRYQSEIEHLRKGFRIGISHTCVNLEESKFLQVGFPAYIFELLIFSFQNF